MNSTENVKSIFKDCIIERDKGIFSQFKVEKSIESFKGATQREWALITQETIDDCILSLRKRRKAAFDAEGYQRKYQFTILPTYYSKVVNSLV